MKLTEGWKDLERLVANKMDGKRNLRGADFSKSDEDVTHDLFTFECKYGGQVPVTIYKWMDQAKKYVGTSLKTPVVIMRRKGKQPLVLMEFSEFHGFFGKADT